MRFYNYLYDSGHNILGYIFKKNDMLGVYDINGRLCMPFTYTWIEGIDGTNSNTLNSEIHRCRKLNGLFDIYENYTKLFSEVTGSYVFEDAFNRTKDRFLLIFDDDWQYIYDRKRQKNIAKLEYDIGVHAIHSEFEQIIYNRHTGLGKFFACVADFDGNEIITSKDETEYIDFSECKNFYEVHNGLKHGIKHFENGNFETILETEYSTIWDTFPNKAIINDNHNHIMIINYQKNKTGWSYNINFKDRENEVAEIHTNENEEDAILHLEQNKKMLLSHYKEYGLDERFICDDIFCEGNGIYKCFIRNGNDMDITYLYKGQAVNFSSVKDNRVHTIINSTDIGWEYIFMSPDGKVIFENTKLEDNKKLTVAYYNNFMNIKPEGLDELIVAKHTKFMSKTIEDVVINKITGEKYEILSGKQPLMVWHNLFVVNEELHLLENKNNHKQKFFSDIVAIFNDYIVIKHNGILYICDRNFDYKLMATLNYHMDYIYRKLIMCTDTLACVVSNDGMELFDFRTVIQGNRVYVSQSTDNFVIGDQYVDMNLLIDDLQNGIISSDYYDLVHTI